MAHAVLLSNVHLSESALLPFWHEERIITKAFRSARSGDDVSFHRSLEKFFDLRTHQCDHRTETRCPMGLAFQLVQQPLHVGLRILGLTGIARRAHPRCTVQGIHLQAGIICKTMHASNTERMSRLFKGVRTKRATVLGQIRVDARIGERDQLYPSRQQGAKFGDLARIPGTEEQAHARRSLLDRWARSCMGTLAAHMPVRKALEHLRHDVKRIRTKDSFARNAFTVFGGNSVVMLSQLLLTPLIARIYGPEAYGIYGLFGALVLNFSSFADLGYSSAYVLPKEKERFLHLFRLNSVLLGAVVLVALVVALLREPLYAALPDWAPLDDFILLLPLAVLSYGMALFCTQWLTRERNFKTSVYIGSSATVVLRVFNLGFGVLRKGSTHGLIIGDVVVNGLATVAYTLALWRSGLRELFSGWRWQGIRELAVEFKRYPLLIFPDRWVSLLGMQLPVFLLIADPVVVGQYALSGSLLMIPLRVLGYSFSTVFIQKAAETVDTDPELLGRITRGLYQRLFWVGLVPFTSMVFFSDVVFSFVLGEVWHDAGVITAYMGLFFFFRLMSEPMVALFYAQRREHVLLIFQIALAVLRLGVMLPLLQFGFGSGPAILGFSIVSALAYLLLGYIMLRSCNQDAMRLTVRSLLITTVACAFFALLRFMVLGSWWPTLQ